MHYSYTQARVRIRLILLLALSTALRAQTPTPDASQAPVTTLPVDLPQPGQPYPVIQVMVDHPILLITDAVPQPSANLAITPFNFPPGGQLSATFTQVQDVISPNAAKMEECPIVLKGPAGGAITRATFPARGVYEIRVIVTDNTHHLTASQNVWINVWDSHSHIIVDGKPDPLCVAPNVKPPTVRTLSPDPGPFHHPRLYTTDWDWKEVSERCTTGKIASRGVKRLQDELKEKFEAESSDFHKLTDELVAYQESNYAGKPPDLTMGVPQDENKSWDAAYKHLKEYYAQLRVACFLAWLSHDPTTPLTNSDDDKALDARYRRLAEALAAVTHIQFTQSYDVETGEFHKDYPLYIQRLDDLGNGFDQYDDLALAYDFIYSHMTPQERMEPRNILFALAAGRTTGARVVFFASGVHNRVERGNEQNGDFMNIEEQKVLAQLVIEGEEGMVPQKLRDKFTKIAVDKSLNPDDFYPCDWDQYTWENGARKQEGARPYPDACAWPFARKVEVDNLKRAVWWNDDWYVTPWGFELNHEAYYGFSAWGLWPTAVAYTRHGAMNQFVAANYYVTMNHILWTSYEKEGYKPDDFSPNSAEYDHHDGGGGDYRQNHIVVMKYMYPDDPLVDYFYSANAELRGDDHHRGIDFNPFIDALFGLEPGIKGVPTIDMEAMAKAKDLPLTVLDPQEGVVAARSSWKADSNELYFDEAWPHTGHMHAEKGNFAFFALGRPWSMPPGYHITESGNQAEVLIQDPKFADDTVTQGYFGEGPNIAPDSAKFPDFEKSYPHCFPTPPGHMFPARESPDKLFLIMAGENTAAYSWCYGPDHVSTGLVRSQFAYPGIIDEIAKRLPNAGFAQDKLDLTPYNTVKYAYRTILFTRGDHPYILVLDDINKDGNPRNYRWQMNCSEIFGGPSGYMADSDGKAVSSDLAIDPGQTTVEGVLRHSPIDDAAPKPLTPDAPVLGPPRLLVRDVSVVKGSRDTPPMEVQVTKLGEDPSGIHRFYMYKNGVPDPKFTVLLYPFRVGEELPRTQWSPDGKTLMILLPDDKTDMITFDRSDPDNRTRITGAYRVKR